MQDLWGLSFGLDFLESSCTGSGVSSLGEQVSVMQVKQGPLVLYIRKNRPRPVNFLHSPTYQCVGLFICFVFVCFPWVFSFDNRSLYGLVLYWGGVPVTTSCLMKIPDSLSFFRDHQSPHVATQVGWVPGHLVQAECVLPCCTCSIVNSQTDSRATFTEEPRGMCKAGILFPQTCLGTSCREQILGLLAA